MKVFDFNLLCSGRSCAVTKDLGEVTYVQVGNLNLTIEEFDELTQRVDDYTWDSDEEDDDGSDA